MRDDCRVIEHHFLDYLYQELDEGWRHRVEVHIADCPYCTREFEEMRETLALIDDSSLEPEEDLSDRFAATVMALIRRRQADSRLPMVSSLSAACIALFVFLTAPEASPNPAPGQRPVLNPSMQAMAEEIEDPLIQNLLARQQGLVEGVRYHLVKSEPA